jgi:hypothetical protein
LVVDHVGPPLRRDEIDGGAAGQVPALALTQLPEQVHGLQEWVRVYVQSERERREKRRNELAEVALPSAEEVEGIVLVRADDPGGFLDDSLEPRGRDTSVDGLPQLGIADCGVEHDAGQLAEELDHLVGGLGYGTAKILEVMTRPRVRLR